jgi:hypothetical protein
VEGLARSCRYVAPIVCQLKQRRRTDAKESHFVRGCEGNWRLWSGEPSVARVLSKSNVYYIVVKVSSTTTPSVIPRIINKFVIL